MLERYLVFAAATFAVLVEGEHGLCYS